MGALYLASKLEECPLRMRDVINVYDVLIQRAAHLSSASDGSRGGKEFHHEPMSYFSQTYYDMKDTLIVAEMQLLKRLGFDVNVTLPYGTLINYMRVLELLDDPKACQMAWSYLNDAYVHPRKLKEHILNLLYSLQTTVYAIYPIPVVVCAAILLVIRHLQLPLPSESTSETKWWELFDASFQDVWHVAGFIMRLYRPRTSAEQIRVVRLLTKKDVRKWLELNRG